MRSVKIVESQAKEICFLSTNFELLQTIDYTSPRGGISVVNSENVENIAQEITSTLLIYRIGDADSGKYSCRPSNTNIATTTVYVIEDEHQQNLKSINNSGNKGHAVDALALLPILLLLFMTTSIVFESSANHFLLRLQ